MRQWMYPTEDRCTLCHWGVSDHTWVYQTLFHRGVFDITMSLGCTGHHYITGVYRTLCHRGVPDIMSLRCIRPHRLALHITVQGCYQTSGSQTSCQMGCLSHTSCHMACMSHAPFYTGCMSHTSCHTGCMSHAPFYTGCMSHTSECVPDIVSHGVCPRQSVI